MNQLKSLVSKSDKSENRWTFLMNKNTRKSVRRWFLERPNTRNIQWKHFEVGGNTFFKDVYPECGSISRIIFNNFQTLKTISRWKELAWVLRIIKMSNKYSIGKWLYAWLRVVAGLHVSQSFWRERCNYLVEQLVL